jgi:hypothetical protein
MPDMAMEQGIRGGRLPTSHTRRIELRDAKMWRRETERQARTGARTSRCPCTLCLFGKPLVRTTQAKHLRDYGRHPMKRLQEEVSSPLRTPFLSLNIRHATSVLLGRMPVGCLHQQFGQTEMTLHGALQVGKIGEGLTTVYMHCSH